MATSKGRQRLEDELARLKEQRVELAAVLGEEDPVGDRGDSAQALQRADDLALLDDRIREIRDQIASLDTKGSESGLADGTVVTLEFADGDVETVRAVTAAEEVSDDEDVIPVTLDSPLGRALAWHHTGDTISYDTPTGVAEAKVVSVTPPAPSNT